MLLEIDILRILGSAILALGLVVVFYASNGYRRTKSKPLLFLALGFIFVTAGAALAGLLYEVQNYDLTTVVAIEAAAEVIGFALIVYSIAGPKD